MSSAPSFWSDPAKVLELMRSLILNGRYDDFIIIESEFYTRFIRTTETREHHEKMFRLLDPIGTEYGTVVRSAIAKDYSNVRDSSVCYFLPSLDNDLAHVVQLTTLLKGYGKHRTRKTFIAGFAAKTNSIGSRNIAYLSKHHDVGVLALERTHKSVVAFSKWFIGNRVGLFVPYSIPMLLSSWVEIFGSERVAWFITKFELESFSRLRHGISGSGLLEFSIANRGRVKWRRATASLPKNLLMTYKGTPRSPIKLVSINREQKIKDPVFLSAVGRVLKANDDTIFYWTGREKDQSIVDFFESNGLGRRNHFLGWVDTNQALPDHDFFLDTFALSGVVAVSAFASGMPTIFMRGSTSWLEAFEPQILQHSSESRPDLRERIDGVLADSPEDYVAKAQQLIDKVRNGNFDGKWQQQIGQSWFFNDQRAAAQHDQVLSHILNDE